jgi:hypothetical protein
LLPSGIARTAGEQQTQGERCVTGDGMRESLRPSAAALPREAFS